MTAMLHGGTTKRNMVIIPLLDPAGVTDWHCPLYPERLIANQELSTDTCPIRDYFLYYERPGF